MAEVGIALGTAPWVWMILTPAAADRTVSLAPLADLASVLTGRDSLVQLVGNLLVFAAFGFLLPVRWRLASNAWTAVVVALITAALASILEVLQFVLNVGRVSSVDDVLLNALGATLACFASRQWWRAKAGIMQ